MLFVILTFLLSPATSLPYGPGGLDLADVGYFNSVEDSQPTEDPSLDTIPGDGEDTDLFPEDPLDPALALEFRTWSNKQPCTPPLSTYRPPVGLENITDNSFGAISTGKKCPPGRYRSKTGNCVPRFSWDESNTTRRSTTIRPCVTSYLTGNGQRNRFILSSMRILFLTLSLVIIVMKSLTD